MHVEAADVPAFEGFIVFARWGAELAQSDQSIVIERDDDVTTTGALLL